MRRLVTLTVLFLALVGARAQLVITEAMSHAATNLGPFVVPQNSDWWELSNFGNTAIDLTGYRWNDNGGGILGADSAPFVGLTIGPGESVIFVESGNTPTEAAFREWWGAQMPASTQIRFYSGNGLGNGGDGIRLWSPTATTDAETTASVDFGTATRGSSFTYSPTTGAFGVLSVNGVNGAYKAATTDDVGSPGVTTGPVVLAAPTIQSGPVSLTVYTNQTATFSVVTAGSPTPTYQWYSNGVAIAGATAATLTLPLVQFESAGTYSVIASNSVGTATTNATLTVTRRPVLAVTEVSSAQSAVEPTAGHTDWWELTNLGDFPVDLFGYRFDDSSRQRANAYTITNHVVIAPGESVIFIDGSSAAAFRQWWGPTLRSSVQIVSYSGSGLGLGSAGDEINVWNPGAIDDTDLVASAVFGTAAPGYSFTYNPDTQAFGELSVVGQYGAFAAVESGDVGSPGLIRADGFGYISIVRSNGTLNLVWNGPSGRNYRIEYKDDLNSTTWNVLATVTSTSTTTSVPVSTTSPTGQRYFQVIMLP